MNRRSFILTIVATGFFIANATLAPDLGTAQGQNGNGRFESEG
jgi:hypothetical protein